ncbi:MAG: tyrosine-protein phosphatase [Solobacterium sp.]|nr:tyrosine-protein phosphatase [Solobacterium sp.]
MELFRNSLNFRDLGGYHTKDGRVVKKGLVYRSASPGFMDEEEFEMLKNMKFHTILDLRSDQEIEKYPYRDMEKTNKIHKSGIITKAGEQIDFSPAGMNKTGKEGQEQLLKIRGYYENIAFENGAYQMMFDELLMDHVPLLIHCAAGKDRTGIAAILFLLVLGVKEEEILKDYLLTNEYRITFIEDALREIDQKEEPELYELMLIYHGVSKNNFNIVLNSIQERYGSYERFFEIEYGLDKEKVELLRDTYLEK